MVWDILKSAAAHLGSAVNALALTLVQQSSRAIGDVDSELS
jgi:hypothetical protein